MNLISSAKRKLNIKRRDETVKSGLQQSKTLKCSIHLGFNDLAQLVRPQIIIFLLFARPYSNLCSTRLENSFRSMLLCLSVSRARPSQDSLHCIPNSASVSQGFNLASSRFSRRLFSLFISTFRFYDSPNSINKISFPTGTQRRIHVDSMWILRRYVEEKISTNFHVISAYFFDVISMVEKSTWIPRTFFSVPLKFESYNLHHCKKNCCKLVFLVFTEQLL